MGTFAEQLRAALGHQPLGIQLLYSRYKNHLHLLSVDTPLPETVHLLPENFLYWIKLEQVNPDHPSGWTQAKPTVVLPLLESGTFNEDGFRIDKKRANAVFNLPNLLRRPNCIHVNLRNQDERGMGGIKGDHVYVAYHKHARTVVFTRYDRDIKKVIVVTSFGVSKEWVARCAEIPAKHIIPAGFCTCEIKKATS